MTKQSIDTQPHLNPTQKTDRAGWGTWVIYLILLMGSLLIVIWLCRDFYPDHLSEQYKNFSKSLSPTSDNNTSASLSEWGTLGDSYGYLNCLFSGCAVVVSAFAFIAFIHALHMQRAELRQTQNEMAAHTKQFQKQVKIASLQMLHENRLVYEEAMKTRWQEAINGMSEKEQHAWKEASDSVFKSLEFLFESSPPDEYFEDTITTLRTDLKRLYHSIRPYMSWYSVFSDGREDIERLLQSLDVEDVTDSKDIKSSVRMLLAHMTAGQRGILWLCYLATHGQEEPNIPDFLPLYDLPLFNPQYLHERSLKEPLNFLSIQLNQLHLSYMDLLEGDLNGLKEYEDSFHENARTAVKESFSFRHSLSEVLKRLRPHTDNKAAQS